MPSILLVNHSHRAGITPLIFLCSGKRTILGTVIDDNDFYTVTFSSALTEVVVSTESDKEDCQRAGLFGVNAE